MKSHLSFKPLLKIFAFFVFLICMLLPGNGWGQGTVTLNAASNGTTLTAVQSGQEAGQFNCGAAFTDGAGNYLNNVSPYKITICAAAGQYLSITFTQIDVTSGGTNNDDVFTYNLGSGAVNTGEIGGGGGNPASLTIETTVGGCVTFILNSNNNGGSGAGLTSNNAGFAATISCVTPPPNDNPCGALSMSVFSTCNYTTVGNTGAQNTVLGTVPNPTCGGYQGSDVWYSATVPPDGNLVFTFSQGTGTLSDAAAALYSSSNGTCNGTFTQITCNDDSGPFLMPAISISNISLAGQTVWIRLWDYLGDNEGTFDVCATGNVGSCTPTTADCLGAIPVCSTASFSNLASGQGCVADLNSTNDGCLAGEHNITYYLIQIGASGTWGFNGTFPVSSNGIEYDWLLYSLPSNPYTTTSACNLTTPIRCSYASQAGKSEVGMGMLPGQTELTEGSSPSGDGYVHWLDAAIAGEYYLLGIDRWSTGGSAYTINFTGTATMNCDITVLPIELISFRGENNGRENMLYWMTASEHNNDYFTIERSNDMYNWVNAGIVDGAGNSNEVLDYSLLDKHPYAQITYYRLRQTDFDGAYKYSQPLSLYSEIISNQLFSELAPNPTNDNFSFNYVGNNYNEEIEVTMINNIGQIVKKINFNPLYKSQGTVISTQDINDGIYQVVIKQGEVIVIRKISVIHN
jgi:hypothetical protein